MLGASLLRAGNGPESSRVLTRQKAVAALPPPLPQEAIPPALPAPAALPALPAARSGDGDPAEEGDREVTRTVVGFGLFDPFGGDREDRR